MMKHTPPRMPRGRLTGAGPGLRGGGLRSGSVEEELCGE